MTFNPKLDYATKKKNMAWGPNVTQHNRVSMY